MGVPADPIEIPGLSPKLSNSSKDLELVTTAIADSDFLTFDYLSTSLIAQQRLVIPIALSNRSGFWYVTGVDQELQEVRTFRMDRIQGSMEVRENKDAFEYPTDFELDQPLATHTANIAIMDIRKGKGQALRSLATFIKDLGEWDQIKVPIFTIESITAQILWHGEDVFVHEPSELVASVIAGLEALVVGHE
jgi:proteasome accessory factor B